MYVICALLGVSVIPLRSEYILFISDEAVIEERFSEKSETSPEGTDPVLAAENSEETQEEQREGKAIETEGQGISGISL